MEEKLIEHRRKPGLAKYRALNEKPIWEGSWGPGNRWYWYFGFYSGTFRFGFTIGDECAITIGPFAAGVWFYGGGANQ